MNANMNHRCAVCGEPAEHAEKPGVAEYLQVYHDRNTRAVGTETDRSGGGA